MNTFNTKIKTDEDGNTWIMLPKQKDKITFRATPNTDYINDLIGRIKIGIDKGTLKGKLSAARIADLISSEQKNKSTLTRIGLAMNMMGYKRHRGTIGRYYIIE